MKIPPGHRVAAWSGSQFLYHPAIHGRITVRCGDGLECPAFDQSHSHKLLGSPHPLSYQIAIGDGSGRTPVSFTVEDPDFRVVSVTVELSREARAPGRSTGFDGPTDVVTFEGSARTCPPDCDD